MAIVEIADGCGAVSIFAYSRVARSITKGSVPDSPSLKLAGTFELLILFLRGIRHSGAYGSPRKFSKARKEPSG